MRTDRSTLHRMGERDLFVANVLLFRRTAGVQLGLGDELIDHQDKLLANRASDQMMFHHEIDLCVCHERRISKGRKRETIKMLSRATHCLQRSRVIFASLRSCFDRLTFDCRSRLFKFIRRKTSRSHGRWSAEINLFL